jgi:VWFA-related protein
VDSRGLPVRGLSPADFRLTLGGRHLPLESAFWVAAGSQPDPPPGATLPDAPEPGRLIVFFFQKDLHASRAPGLLRLLEEAGRLLGRLPEEDRVAVLSFDSHLKLWSDFTRDRARLRAVLERSILFEERPRAVHGDGRGMLAHFDFDAARKAAATETALLVLGQALRELPGPKSLAFFGWGMGRWTPGVGVMLEADYGPARQALIESRTSVFTLDVTNADYHTLEVGLQQVAEDTGGFYARTHLFTAQALRRLEGALAGHYLLGFEAPDLPPGEHRLRIEVRDATVLSVPTYRLQPRS